jgi:tRNA-Thr(GGU) m(6)t(6)A37 methyltransferase TsaA
VIYWCHLARAAKLVVTPYRDTLPHGVFATRAPSRPNPIGLSSVRLLGIDGRYLRVSEIDVLDGTPVLDVKPYVPQYDSYPDQRCGWLDRDEPRRSTRIADDRFQRART